MATEFVHVDLETKLDIKTIVSMSYQELPINFANGGEAHDFWELMYIDHGELLFTVRDNTLLMKKGEIFIVAPNTVHAVCSSQQSSANISIITFSCKNPDMERCFHNKIFHLNQEEKNLLSLLFKEGLATYHTEKWEDHLHHVLVKNADTAYGGRQMIKLYLEMLLITIHRNRNHIAKHTRFQQNINGIRLPSEACGDHQPQRA